MSVNGSNKSVSSWIASVHHSATLSLVVLVCGIILAGVVYEIIDHWETRAREAEFEQRAGVYAETLQRKLRRQGATISMVATLFKIYDDVPSERFRDFVREPLDKHSELKFFEWIVFIPSDQQNKDETAGSRAENEDTEKPNGKIRSLDRHPPADRADDGEQQVLSEDYKDFLQNTWGENVGDEEEASGAVVHTETGSREYSVVVPIFERGGNAASPPLKGWLRMGCDIRKTIETAFSGRMPLGLDVSVYGSGTTKQKEPLHVYREKRPQSAYRESDDTTLKQLYELKLGGHKWSLLVKPSPQFLRKTGTSQPAVMAGLVLVFACSGSLFLWIMARKERRSRQLAESRADVIEKLEKTQSRLRETLTDLRRAEHILADQERQKALSSVAKGIAHDFNNALSPVRGYADLLLENPDQLTDEETVRRYVQRIKKATDAATETVRRMSKFYHDGNVDNHGPLDVNDMVTEAIDLARDSMQEGMGEITKRINWITEFHSTGDIYAAEDEVREMLANVICNSMEAIQEAGTIQVRTHSERNNVFIAIEDDGVGMDDETLLSCTDPFFTTKGPDTRGLGLSVSEGIVARHGGSLRVNSEEGGGTTVLIKWPTASTGEGRECEAAEGALPEGLSFLIIGNQKLERTLLSDLLRSLGYEVKISATARGGVEECAEQNYDVVIVGTHLQNMRLKECLEQLSAQGKPPRVIVSTDETFENGEKWEEYSDLVDDWLPKPIQLESLRSTIRKVVSEG